MNHKEVNQIANCLPVHEGKVFKLGNVFVLTNQTSPAEPQIYVRSKVFSRRMEIPDDTLIFSFKSPKRVIGGTEIEFSGEMVFTWPYKWDKDIGRLQSLVDSLANDILDFVNKRFCGTLGKDPLILIKDSCWMGIYNAPLPWRDIAFEDDSIYRKYFFCNAYYYIAYIADDFCEKQLGKPQHPEFVKSMGRLLYKLFRLEFRREQDYRESKYYVYAVGVVPAIENWLLLYFDMVKEMETRYELTPLKMKALATSIRNLFEFQTWYGTENSSHLFNLPLRHLLRSWIAGLDFVIEFIMVLDGFFIPDKVREDFYFRRQYDSARTLGYFQNDIFSVVKELEETKRFGKMVDNTVLIYIHTGMTFEKALEKTIQRHNDKALEFRNEVKSMLADEDLLFDFDEEEKIIYFRALNYIGSCVSNLIQTHIATKRYKNHNLEYQFLPYKPLA